MAFEIRDMSGSLFPNDKKEQPNHADEQGKCMVMGKMFYVNVWNKKGPNGPYRSLSFKPVMSRGGEHPQAEVYEKLLNGDESLDDTIPF